MKKIKILDFEGTAIVHFFIWSDCSFDIYDIFYILINIIIYNYFKLVNNYLLI